MATRGIDNPVRKSRRHSLALYLAIGSIPAAAVAERGVAIYNDQREQASMRQIHPDDIVTYVGNYDLFSGMAGGVSNSFHGVTAREQYCRTSWGFRVRVGDSSVNCGLGYRHQ